MQTVMADEPRYPEIFVECESDNPLALVAAVREALRLAHVDRRQISEFSDEALGSTGQTGVRGVCRRWVQLRSQELN